VQEAGRALVRREQPPARGVAETPEGE
jgi:hypothetical protein